MRKPTTGTPPTTTAPTRPVPTVAEPALKPADAMSEEAQRLVLGLRQRPIAEQQLYLRLRLAETLALSKQALSRLDDVLASSQWLGFGSPKASEPEMSREECRARREAASVTPGNPLCGAPHMVPLFDPQTESESDARVCIDQYEFPNIPCEYPVVWVRANEAAEICELTGKRLCRAHEWEGACAGRLLPAELEYPYTRLSRVHDYPKNRRERRLQLEYWHNKEREVRWAYGLTKDHARCATTGRKSPSCEVVDFGTCGTNDFPAGAFPECQSPLGVYDQHGNAAEHMSLPLYPEELRESPAQGWTEMKGSWFIFSAEEAHPDDCRWRAKNWHSTRVDDPHSHRNYHLGFRCCRDLP